MKISFKRAAALTMSAILAVSCLAGCTGKDTDKDEQGRTIISVGGYPTEEGAAKDLFDKQVDEFMTANPDVNIKKDTYAFDVKTFFSKAAGGQLPTVFNTALTEVSTCIQSGYIKDITDAAKKYGYYDNVNPMLMDGIVAKDGVFYGAPVYTYALGIAFNTKLFEQAGLVNPDGTFMIPETWDELAQFAVQIKEKTGKAGFITPTINNCGGWLWEPIAWSYGTDFMEQDKDGKWQATFDTPEAVAALEFYKDLRWKYDVLPSKLLLSNAEAAQEFLAGNAGMLMRAPDFVNQIPGMGADPNDFGMFPMPAGPERRVTLVGGSLYMVAENATDDQVDAALRWMKKKTDFELTEELKKTKMDDYALALEEGRTVGLFTLSNWNSDTEIVKWDREYATKMRNVDERNVKPYNDFVEGKDFTDIELQPEEPVCAQELYAILDKAVQEVFTNKNADCAKLIKEACSDFQVNYLDYL